MSIRTTDDVVEERRLERNAKNLEEINSNTKAIRKQLEGPSLSVRLLHGFLGGCDSFRKKTIENRRKRGVEHPGEAMPQDIIALIIMLAGFYLVWSSLTANGHHGLLGIILIVAAIIITRL